MHWNCFKLKISVSSSPCDVDVWVRNALLDVFVVRRRRRLEVMSDGDDDRENLEHWTLIFGGRGKLWLINGLIGQAHILCSWSSSLDKWWNNLTDQSSQSEKWLKWRRFHHRFLMALRSLEGRSLCQSGPNDWSPKNGDSMVKWRIVSHGWKTPVRWPTAWISLICDHNWPLSWRGYSSGMYSKLYLDWAMSD